MLVVISYTGVHYYEHISIQISAETIVAWGPSSSEHYFYTSEGSTILSVSYNMSSQFIG